VRFDTRLLAHRFKQRLGTLRLGSFVRRAGTAVGVGIARNDMGERELPARRDQQLCERYGVATALSSVHADNDLLEHRRALHEPKAITRSRDQTSVTLTPLGPVSG
jgi:hypothetical protein